MVQGTKRLLAFVAVPLKTFQFRQQGGLGLLGLRLLARQPLTFFKALLPLLFVELAFIPLDFGSRQGLCLLLLDLRHFFAPLIDHKTVVCNRQFDAFELRVEARLVSRLLKFLSSQRLELSLDIRNRAAQLEQFVREQLHFERPCFLLQHLIRPRLARLPLQRV